MLCNRKVLIVLDDVDHLDQLEALAGRRKWFGDGSRIIITTRDQHLLTIDEIEVSPISLLSHEEAVLLFNKHAYNAKKPLPHYEVFSQEVVTYAAGLPLALIVLGSFLYDKDKDEWVSTLDRLKSYPEMGIVEKLKISYDRLKEVEKELFLDIACFFRWERKDKAMKILDACGFYPVIGVKVLMQKALITVSEDGDQFDMHDLVQEMAHYIVRGEHPKNLEKYSRIWRDQDIEDMCSNINATMENDKIEAIQCIAYNCSSNFMMLVSNMKKLRFLKVTTNTSFDEGPFLSNDHLRYMDWKHYLASRFPENFQPRKLLVLKMKRSLQKELWKGYKYLPCLKEMELSDMKPLVRTPDFGGLPCLQKLILKRCESLEEIHQSLGNHSTLVHVSVRNCDKLTRFPTIVKMDKLEKLILVNCEALIEFPNIETNMDKLVTLSLINVGIEILPSTIGEYCTNITLLSLEDCPNLKSIDGNFHALKGPHNITIKLCLQFKKLPKHISNGNLDGIGLRTLDLSWCNLKDGDMTNEIGELSNLRELDLSGNEFTRLDFSLSRLTRLKLLNLGRCGKLVELPELPSSLAILRASWCESLEVIKDDVHRSCKCLCEVSIQGARKNITGGDRLLESMLRGKAVKSRCMFLQLESREIPRGFKPCLVRRERCRMQLPENWYNHFSGFLFCITSYGNEKSVGGSSMRTWVMYFPFSLLRHNSWWDPTSTAVEMGFGDSRYSKMRRCGLKLVPKVAAGGECSSETTPTTHSSSSSNDNDVLT